MPQSKEPDAKTVVLLASDFDRYLLQHKLLSSIVHHWDEFGPERGFEEKIAQARAELAISIR